VNGANGTIAPNTAQTVNDGATTIFTLTPSSGFHIASVAGTCGGTLTGSSYTTNAVTVDCTVIASFAQTTHVVTPSVNGGNGAIAPNTTQTVNDGATTSFTLTPSSGFHIAGVAGTCGGTLTGSSYTTNAVTADCTVIASFAVNPLVFTTQPADVSRGHALGTVVVTEQDGSGNTIIDNSSSVDLTIAACGGSVDLGSVAMVNGVATLTSAQVFYTQTSTPGLQINATTGTLNGTSQFFDVLPNTDLVFADGYEGCRL
jgi:Divergent InlB B-repeat domain